MISINLLPLAQRETKWPINKLLLIASIFVGLGCSSIYSYNVFTIWSVEKKLQDTRNQYELLQPTVEIMHTVSSKQQTLDKKNSILATLTKERNSWYSIIQHLIAATPQSIWFTDIGQSSDKGLIQMKGVATNYPAVAEFVQNLEHHQFFSDPVLIRDASEPASQIINFEIMVNSKGM
jgi:type IV pilus assembly protein PilN